MEEFRTNAFTQSIDRKIDTGHCTGARVMELLKEELGDAVEQIYTGMEFRRI